MERKGVKGLPFQLPSYVGPSLRMRPIRGHHKNADIILRLMPERHIEGGGSASDASAGLLSEVSAVISVGCIRRRETRTAHPPAKRARAHSPVRGE
jgi:hypothetical protein